jgi:hypothetical protein
MCEFLGFSLGEDYMSATSKWLHEKKFYSVNILDCGVGRDMADKKWHYFSQTGLVRYQNNSEEDAEVNHGMEYIFQGTEQGGAGEMVIFFGEVAPRAIDDYKSMKTVLGAQVRYALDGRSDVEMDVN